MKQFISCVALTILLAGCGSATATPSNTQPIDQSVLSSLLTPSATNMPSTPTSTMTPAPTQTLNGSGHPTNNSRPNSVPASQPTQRPQQPPAQQSVPQPTATPAPTSTPTPQGTPTPTPAPTSTPAPTATPHPSTMSDGAPWNPWGYDFEAGNTISSPPSNFCSYFNCIANFGNGSGYVMECKDAMYSKSGGKSGSCSGHQGNNRALYSH